MAVMAKRGSMLVFISIITLLIALFVGVVYPMIAKAYASGEVALKVAAARDIALILDTVYASPYDIELNYDFDLSKFVVKISADKVEIDDPSFGAPESDPTLASYSFVPVDDKPNFILNNPKKIVFKKEKGVLTVT